MVRKKKVLSDAGKLDVLSVFLLIIFILVSLNDINKTSEKKLEEQVCIETRLTLNKNEVHVFCGKKVNLDKD